jgi:hypothetical protein
LKNRANRCLGILLKQRSQIARFDRIKYAGYINSSVVNSSIAKKLNNHDKNARNQAIESSVSGCLYNLVNIDTAPIISIKVLMMSTKRDIIMISIWYPFRTSGKLKSIIHHMRDTNDIPK